MFFLYVSAVALFILIGIFVRYYLENIPAFYIVSRFYDIMEFTLLAFYFSLNTLNSVVKKITLFSIIPFILFCVYDFLSTTKPTYAFLPLVIECLTLLVVLLYILYEKMSFSFDYPIYQTSFFWIAVAFIIYFAGNFFLFLYSKNSFNDDAFKLQYTIIYSFVTILKNILLCVGVSVVDQKISNNKSSNPIEINSNNPFKPLI